MSSNRSIVVTLGSTSPRTLPDDLVFAAFVGESVTFSFPEPLARDGGGGTVAFTPAVTVSRQPSGSALSFTSGAATPTHAGLHTVTVQNGGLPARTVHFVAYPASALTAPVVKEPNRQVLLGATLADSSPRTEPQVRETLRSFTLEQVRARRDLTAFDALTTSAPLPLGIDWRAFLHKP